MSTKKVFEIRAGWVFEDGEKRDNYNIPFGTRESMGLGSIEFLKTHDGPIVVRYSQSGREVYRTLLKPNGFWEIGPDYARRVVPALEEADPVRRLLRLCETPLKNLRVVAGHPLELSVHKQNLGCYISSGQSSWEWLTDGQVETLSVEPWRKGQHCYGERSRVKISFFTYAIEARWETVHGGCIVRRLGDVYVTPNCDPAKLGAAMTAHRYGPGATVEMRVAEESGRLLEWIKGQISAGGDAWHVVFSGKEFRLSARESWDKNLKAMGSNQYEEHTHATARAFNRLGIAEQLSILPPEQAEHLIACLQEDKALAWLLGLQMFFRQDGRLYSAGENRELCEVCKDRFGMYDSGPISVMAKHGLYEAVLEAALDLGEPLAVEHVNAWAHEGDHERAACPDHRSYYKGAAQYGALRFVFVEGRSRGEMDIRIVEADGAESMALRPSQESPANFVWLDSEAWGTDHNFRYPARDGGSRLHIWRVR